MSLSDFEVLQKLGSGAYSTVYKVKRIEDGEFYAMKKVDINDLTFKEKQNALNEVRILASIKHTNIIAYKEAFFDEPSGMLCIVMEYADGGDILQMIKDHQKQGKLFEEDDIWNIFIQATRGLKALHDIKIIHRDLKCANIFLTKDKVAKLGDLNVSKVMKKDMYKTQTGTPYYASPEVWKDEPYDSRSDIWSMGCVLYEMITLKPPFRAQNMEGLYKKVIKGVYPRINLDVYSEDISQLVKSLLQVNPELRPTCEQVLNNPEVMQYADHLCPEKLSRSKQVDLLRTIRVPKKLLFLGGRLPKAQYKKPPNEIELEAINEVSMDEFFGEGNKKKMGTVLSAQVSPQNSLTDIKVQDSQIKSVVEENMNPDSLNKRRRRKKNVGKIYGSHNASGIMSNHHLQQQSTKETLEQPDSGVQIRNAQIIQQAEILKKQQELLELINKNVQNDMFIKKYDSIDLGPNMHIISRNKKADEEEQIIAANNEIKQFQKIANIYERHNYIKRQIEQTKKEMEDDLKAEKAQRFMSVPRQRPNNDSSLLPQIDYQRGNQPQLMIKPIALGYAGNEDLMNFYKKSISRINATPMSNRDEQSQQQRPNFLPGNVNRSHNRNYSYQGQSVQNSPRGPGDLYQPLYSQDYIQNLRVENNIMANYLQRDNNRSMMANYSNNNGGAKQLFLGYHQQPPQSQLRNPSQMNMQHQMSPYQIGYQQGVNNVINYSGIQQPRYY